MQLWAGSYLPGELILPLPYSHQFIWNWLVMMLRRHVALQRQVTQEPFSLKRWTIQDSSVRMEESELNTVALLTLHDFRPVRGKARLDLCPVPDCIPWQFPSCIFYDVSHNCSGAMHMLGPSDGTADLLTPQLTVLLRIISASLCSLLCSNPPASHP